MPRCGKVVPWLIGALILIILIAVLAAVFSSENKGITRTFALADYFNDTIRYKTYRLWWITDKEYLHKTEDKAVLRYNVETGAVTEFLNNKTFAEVDATGYLVSGDHKYVCLESNYTKHWRHSYSASYSIYDVEGKSFITPSYIPQEVQYLLWAPNGNKLAFVWNYDIYMKMNATAEATQITTNGEKNKILNGIPDWVYEEEIFSSHDAMWWSPNGKFMAYVEFNDSQVHTIEFSWYGSGQYPETVAIPYPKAGSTIPTVKLFVVDSTDTSKITEVTVPDSVGASDHYLSSVTWITDDRIAAQWVKRSQDYVLLQVYDFDGSSWNKNMSHEEKSETGWVGQYAPFHPFFAADNLSFYKIMSDTRGYKHIHYISAGKATAVTSGPWEVIYISKLTKDAIYYVSNEYRNQPGQRNLYKIEIGSSHSSPRCLTCDLQGSRCLYNSGYLSQDATYYRMDCYGPGLPLFTIRDNRGAGSEVRVLEDNKALGNIMAQYKMPKMRRGTFKIAGFDLSYQMMLPPDFDISQKYPLLIDVYAGPCSQKVDYRYRLRWVTYLASTEKIIVASFDGRGSGYQGDKILHSIYHRLGTYEVEDQISAVRKFIQMGFIDEKKIAIWGWSYGGYVTSMALGSGSGLFKCGIAVAPVSKWEYYDAVYTERYMGQPANNSESYKNSTVTSRAKNFKSVDYLLVHGTADDNVHFQQAAQISKALVDEQVDFEAMWYTDKNHEIGGSAYQHLFTHMSNFLQKCFAIRH